MTDFGHLLREHAPALMPAKAGVPLIRSTPALGRHREWMVGRFTVDHDMKGRHLELKLRWAWSRFVDWMTKRGYEYKGGVHVSGPYYHFELGGLPERNGLEYARSMPQSLEESKGSVDYKVGGWFDVPDAPMEVIVNGNDSSGARGEN